MNEILVNLASISPRHYAEAIRLRNEGLLANLDLLRPYVGTMLDQIPDPIFSRAISSLKLGCPHCMPTSDKSYGHCQACMWTACNSICMYVPFTFNDISMSLDEISDIENRVLSVRYTKYDAYLLLDHKRYSTILPEREFQECEAFIRAHLEWAALPDWGRAYKPGVWPEWTPGDQIPADGGKQ